MMMKVLSAKWKAFFVSDIISFWSRWRFTHSGSRPNGSFDSLHDNEMARTKAKHKRSCSKPDSCEQQERAKCALVSWHCYGRLCSLQSQEYNCWYWRNHNLQELVFVVFFDRYLAFGLSTDKIVEYRSYVEVVLSCYMDFARFPMDTHECYFHVNSANHPNSELVYENTTLDISDTSRLKNYR